MKTKSVFLKCRFGDHLPNLHKPVDLAVDDANYLISEGLATEVSAAESKESAASDNKIIAALREDVKDLTTKNTELEGQVASLTTKNTELEGQVALLTPPPADAPKK